VVAKQLIELMGGTIGVESVVGAGSVFWFELGAGVEPQPVPELPSVPVAELRPRDAGAHKRLLLYVEDNPANLSLVEQLIARRPDLRLLTAITATLGLALARAHQPEVILMDINLPDMSGLEALRILSADVVTCHIPVVAISANAMPHDIAKGMQAGFFRYLTKPIKVKEFNDTLNAALEAADRSAAQPGGVS